jgi:hypothetical protein
MCSGRRQLLRGEGDVLAWGEERRIEGEMGYGGVRGLKVGLLGAVGDNQGQIWRRCVATVWPYFTLSKVTPETSPVSVE